MGDAGYASLPSMPAMMPGSPDHLGAGQAGHYDRALSRPAPSDGSVDMAQSTYAVSASSSSSYGGTAQSATSPPSILPSSRGAIQEASSSAGSSVPSSNRQDTVMRKSCQHCRKRKIRCLPSETNEAVCKACAHKGQVCVFAPQSTMGRPPKGKRAENQQADRTTEKADMRQSQASRKTATSDQSTESTSPRQTFEQHHRRLSEQASMQASMQAAEPPKLSRSSATYVDASSRAPSPKRRKFSPESPASYHHYADYTSGYAAQPVLPLPQPYSAAPSLSTLPLPHVYPGYPAFNDYRNVVSMYGHQMQMSLTPSHPPSSYHLYSKQILPPVLASATPSTPFTDSGSRSIPPQYTAEFERPSSSRHAAKPVNTTTKSPTSTNFKGLSPRDPQSSKIQSDSREGRTSASTRIHTAVDAFQAFRDDTLLDIVSSFHDMSASSGSSRPVHQSPDLSSLNSVPSRKWRVLAARAMSLRDSKVDLATSSNAPAGYARSLVAPLWEHIPLDVIALVTTGRPSCSGPSHQRASRLQAVSALRGPPSEDSLYVRLLREDESTDFRIREVHDDARNNRSPHLKYAPTKAAVSQFFDAYCARHPFASVILNEKCFKEDLQNDCASDVLINVVVGSALARAPCLLEEGGNDATDIGNYFFDYVQDQLLARKVSDALDLSTIQSLILWGSHEQSHMRTRRSAALFSCAEILLRERLKRNQQNPTWASAASSQSRDMVENELTVNCLWMIAILSSWASLSMLLPQSSIAANITDLPMPPSSTATSLSFAYSYLNSAAPPTNLQHSVRKTIERFSETSQLLSVIVTLKNQAQLKMLLNPEPGRSIKPHLDNSAADPNIARWLVDLATWFKVSGDSQALIQQAVEGDKASSAMVASRQTNMSNASRAFLVVTHAILALHQLLPYAKPTGEADHGAPSPLPTVESLKTAMDALRLLSLSVDVNSMDGVTRTQALLFDAMPRIVGILDLFTSTALESLDHFILVTTSHDTLRALLADLSNACDMLDDTTPDQHTVGRRLAFERAATALRSVASVGSDYREDRPNIDLRDEVLPGNTGVRPSTDSHTQLQLPDIEEKPTLTSREIPAHSSLGVHQHIDRHVLPESLSSSSASTPADSTRMPWLADRNEPSRVIRQSEVQRGSNYAHVEHLQPINTHHRYSFADSEASFPTTSPSLNSPSSYPYVSAMQYYGDAEGQYRSMASQYPHEPHAQYHEGMYSPSFGESRLSTGYQHSPSVGEPELPDPYRDHFKNHYHQQHMQPSPYQQTHHQFIPQ